jgi:hypothetical protein
VSVAVRFKDALRSFIVPWLSDRPGQENGKTVGFRVVSTMVEAADMASDMMVQALQAPWPGLGTPTALTKIGRSRGMIRGQGESDDDYAARLRTWLDRWRQAGSMLAIGRSIHEYLANHPRVRVYNRAGACTEIAETTGDVTHFAAGTTAWDWDSVSNPERAGYWWDLWICVYPTEWADTGLWGDGRLWGDRDSGIGHIVTREEVDAIKGEIAQYKSAHSHVRAVIWTSDAALFDPTVPASQPDGTWGQWSVPGSDPRVASGRNTTSCRYWEL